MADSHLQVNPNGTTESRKTSLWPTSKDLQKEVLRSIFERDCWTVSSINNITGPHWKIEVHSESEDMKINLFISTIRDESRKDDEFKMQLGGTYPDTQESGWINLVLGIYTIQYQDLHPEYIIAGYEYNDNQFDFSKNPSMRGTRTEGLRKARIYGMYSNEKCKIFRPEFIYYYIQYRRNKVYETETAPELPITPLDEYNLFATALQTKPFLLLAGISGTGKSQKVQELAFMSCPEELQEEDSTTPGNYCLIEVKPNWHDSTELLGYYSALSEKYELTDFIRFAIKAIKNPKYPFFLCLDEMNLAPVEQYFAEFLSVLETRKKTANGIKTQPLLTKEKFTNCKLQKYVGTDNHGVVIMGGKKFDMCDLYSDSDREIIDYLKSNGLHLPENLFVIGTVNMDDTTHQFSRKVIDRAFTIEMNGGKMAEMFSPESKFLLEYRKDPIPLSSFKSEFIKAYEVLEDEKYSQYKDDIISIIPSLLGDSDGENKNSINGILSNTPFRVSYRVQNELVLYLSVLIKNAGYPAEINNLIPEAMLAILLEKILPRIQGEKKQLETKDNSNILRDLMKFIEEHFKPEMDNERKNTLYYTVMNKLTEMDKKLEGYYTNFF